MPFDVCDAGDERDIGQVNDAEGEIELGLIGRVSCGGWRLCQRERQYLAIFRDCKGERVQCLLPQHDSRWGVEAWFGGGGDLNLPKACIVSNANATQQDSQAPQPRRTICQKAPQLTSHAVAASRRAVGEWWVERQMWGAAIQSRLLPKGREVHALRLLASKPPSRRRPD